MTDELIYKLKVLSKYLRILIVENDLKLSKELHEVFKCFFLNADMATDGIEALSLYKTNRYDIVITELDMPYIGGKELLKKIREISCNQTVIVLTDCKQDSNINANAVLSKPYKLEKLLKILLECTRDILLENNEKETKVKNALYEKKLMPNQTHCNKNITNINQEIKILFSNIEYLNNKFSQGIHYIQSNYYVSNVIKTIASIFNGYYQNFCLLKEVNCLANSFLKISIKLYKGNFDNSLLNNLTIQVLIEFLYMEIINLQHELFIINEKKDIEYIKTTFESSMLMVLDKLEKNDCNKSLSYELSYALSK